MLGTVLVAIYDTGKEVLSHWALLYKKLVTDLTGLVAQGELAEGQLRLRVVELADACNHVALLNKSKLT